VAQTFSGSWTIEVREVSPFPDHSFVILGSGNADGRYIVPFFGERPAVTADGDGWTLEIQCLAHGTSDVWVTEDAYPAVPQGGQRCAPAFDPEHGLVMHVGTGTLAWDGPPPEGAFRFSGMRLLCISHDPDLNPGPMPPHPDFTLPGAQG
jgi:hypothetical protein